MRPHHLWVSVPLPQGLPTRGQGWFGRRGCVPSQVDILIISSMMFPYFLSQSWAWPGVWGPAQEAAHTRQVFPGEAEWRPDGLEINSFCFVITLWPSSGITYERNWPWEGKGNAINVSFDKTFYPFCRFTRQTLAWFLQINIVLILMRRWEYFVKCLHNILLRVTNVRIQDAANIMRVISIKNYCDNIRVIIQLMQYHNKVGKCEIWMLYACCKPQTHLYYATKTILL